MSIDMLLAARGITTSMMNEAKALMRMFSRIERSSVDLPRLDTGGIVFPISDADISAQGHNDNVMVPMPMPMSTEFESVFDHGTTEVLQESAAVSDEQTRKIFQSPDKFSFEDVGKHDSIPLNHVEYDPAMPDLVDITKKGAPPEDIGNTVGAHVFIQLTLI